MAAPIQAEPARVGRPANAFDEERSVVWEERARNAAREVDWEAPLPPEAATTGWRFRRRLKRVIDIVGASVGLLLLSPMLLLIAVCVALDSSGPIFYRWRVIGRVGRPFTGYKFRTMVVDADRRKDELLHLNEMAGPVFKIRNDPRITAVGRVLRKYSLDELPQLWSVLVGDMSLVGPRPLSAREFATATPMQRQKLAAVPGITCLWQVLGRSEVVEFNDWVELDLKYIREWSLWLDFVILLRTIPVVVFGRGAY